MRDPGMTRAHDLCWDICTTDDRVTVSPLIVIDQLVERLGIMTPAVAVTTTVKPVATVGTAIAATAIAVAMAVMAFATAIP